MTSNQSSFLFTLGDISQFDGLFNGVFLKGHREPRIAMVGRSNVGKSSLINALLGKSLARTSNQPGKTRAIHFYHWAKGKKIIADMPGYGFALKSKEERLRWEEMIDRYLSEDQNLERALVLLDARHGPTENDQQAIEFLSLRGIPVTFVFSKIDLLKTQSQRAIRKKEALRDLKDLGTEGEIFWVSSRSHAGMGELSRLLETQHAGKGSV